MQDYLHTQNYRSVYNGKEVWVHNPAQDEQREPWPATTIASSMASLSPLVSKILSIAWMRRILWI